MDMKVLTKKDQEVIIETMVRYSVKAQVATSKEQRIDLLSEMLTIVACQMCGTRGMSVLNDCLAKIKEEQDGKSPKDTE